MSSNQHIIKKVSLDLQMQNSTNSYSLQRRCSGLVKNSLTNSLDKLLTVHFPGDDITRIQKIEIDIGNITTEELDNTFIDKCMRQLTEQLKTITLQKKSLENNIEQIKPEQNTLEQFFFFLQTGRLTWSAQPVFFYNWKEQLLNAININKEYFNNRFSELLAGDTPIIKRLVLQFDKDLIQELFRICEPKLRKEITELMLVLPEFIEKLLIQFDDTFIEELFSGYGPLPEKEITELMQLLKKVVSQKSSLRIYKKIPAALTGALNKTPGSKIVPTIHEIKDWLSRQPAASFTNLSSAQAEQELEHILEQLKSPSPADEIKEFQKNDDFNSKQELIKKVIEPTEAAEDKVKETAVFINNAGLIILHPFLGSLFKTTGLMQNNSFINDEAKYKAVHLLQYMATGEEQLPEYLMPLNKILCGLPGEMHIDRFIALTQEEKREANDLLKAVIEHWAALKNSSVKALQETFLQRRGKLGFIAEDKFWKLQVERTGVDVLLDKIPWGYSYIQLPWMEYALVTEW